MYLNIHMYCTLTSTCQGQKQGIDQAARGERQGRADQGRVGQRRDTSLSCFDSS